MDNIINIAVYRDTFEDFWSKPEMDDTNIAEVYVSIDFARQYWNERLTEAYNTFDDFLDNFTCDDTEDFYEYASERNAIIRIERWK